MSRGLFWLPLLAIFVWLTWAGWNEYQKLEAYKTWAAQFERAKYDIYAVLGQKGRELTWGLPTRKGPVSLETVSLNDVQSIRLLVNEQPAALEAAPNQGKAILELTCADRAAPIRIPFTEVPLAAKWGEYLQANLSLQ
ncbi:hypothetical protein [Stenomitos frigidus]|uniref:Uncharacterized protein n=1 Tax=Stenomitos frigidus ULC18 TaxID=2107698 RepID=A0A2T1E5K4_9CYAN|nr:hypothetical protein [Stenomitos frigidus]PSB28027.1 hypothetical protein C7B82_14315 [Stenomitos frigidus ULC18]